MPLYFLHVQNLSAQRKDGLEVPVAALFGRTACRVTLDEEYFAGFRVAVRAVGQFAGQSAAAHGVLALHAFTCLAGCDARRGGEHHFVADELGLFRMLFQIVGERFAHGLLHGSRHLRVAELGLRLSLELRFCHFDGDDGGESFAEVFTCYLYLCLLYLL